MALYSDVVAAIFVAVTSGGGTVDRQRMQQHLRVGAVRIGALRLPSPVPSPVMNQRSVTVLPPGQTLAAPVDDAGFNHDVFLAAGSDAAAPPRRAEAGVSSQAPRVRTPDG